MAKKLQSTMFKLVSTADTGCFYIGWRNVKKVKEKLSFRKYDPKLRKHVEFKESKMK